MLSTSFNFFFTANLAKGLFEKQSKTEKLIFFLLGKHSFSILDFRLAELFLLGNFQR